MPWLLSFLVAALSGILGLFSSGFVAAAYANWYHVSTREGAAGFFVVGMALLGGIAGFIVGLVSSRVVAAPSFGKVIACSSGVVLGIAGLAALLLYVLADIPPRIDGDELRLEVEIRLPAGYAKPDGKPEFTLGSVINHTQRASESGELKVNAARLENGRWIITAEVQLFTTRGLRSIGARLDEKDIAGFIVPLPARPGKAHEQWSEWGPRPPAGSPPWPDTEPSYRFRVQRIPPPPPPPTMGEIEAREEAETQAEFDAIAPDAPLAVWIPYTPPWQNETRRLAAIQRVASRPGLVDEIGALALDPDPRQAEAALRLISHLPQPSADLIPSVIAAGRDIIARIRKFNATTPEQDPGFEGAADVSIRFSSWMEAVRTLREKCGGDFTPELREILELSRVRTNSHAMRADVLRVASYYMKTWTGLEPLPGDPPPR